MASPSQPNRTYHVFLSFRGPDSRMNLASHFYKALGKAGIYTYIDSEELEKGDRILDALPKAIEDSCIALIIFSENYATSHWCLREVTKIMDCKKTNGLLVLPVFLQVDPREVRGGRKSYKEALEKHKDNFNLEDVEKWKKALTDAGELSGWVYNNKAITELNNGKTVQSGCNDSRAITELNNGKTVQSGCNDSRAITELNNGKTVQSGCNDSIDEAGFVEVIVDHISRRLERIPLDVAQNTVAMLSQVTNVIKILNMSSEDEVQDEILMIGLWAMGGMGKTTLAKLLYNSIFKNFQDAAFLEIQSDSKNLRSLQKIMLCRLTNANIRVTSLPEGIASMKDRLKCKRILLILDGVDDVCQIDDLIGNEHNFFGKGSRIIVTTRNKSVFRQRKSVIYEVKALEDPQACELFSTCASIKVNEEGWEDVVKRALHCTGCVPLALKELGSAFCASRREHGRGGELGSFARDLPTTIHKELRKSLDGLDDTTKYYFLDIACFFNGWNRKYVEGLLSICYAKSSCNQRCYEDECRRITAREANTRINDLIERSLITDENGTLKVHRLIQLMGQKTADGKHLYNLNKRRRLWLLDDVVRVLSENEEKYDVESIVLAPEEPEEIEKIGSNPFKKLKHLRLLIMINIKLRSRFPGPIDLPHQLRWFEWPECPAPSLQISSVPLNLGVLAVRKSLLVKKPWGNTI